LISRGFGIRQSVTGKRDDASPDDGLPVTDCRLLFLREFGAHLTGNGEPTVEPLRVMFAGVGVLEDYFHHTAVFLGDLNGVTDVRTYAVFVEVPNQVCAI